MIKDIPCARITQLDTDLIKIEYKDNYLVELEDAIAVDNIVQEMTGMNPVFVLMNTNGRYSVFSSEAQQYLSYEAPMVVQNNVLAFAVVVNTLPNRILAKFYLKFFKLKYPFEIYKNEKNALSFLNSQRMIKH